MNAISMNTPLTFAPDPEDTRPLRDAFGKFTTGVTLITCPSADGPVWIVANSFSSVSLDPALVMWAVDRASRRYPYFEAAEEFAIHVLASDQRALCNQAMKDPLALKDLPHGLNASGVPLLENCLARFECKTSACHPAGDHVIVVGEVTRVEMREGAPLTFFAGDFGQL